MEVFCHSVKKNIFSDSLCRMIQGRGAFGRFKDSIRPYGIEENWYKFRDRALKEIVKDWCEGKGIEYIDDEPPPAEPETRTFPRRRSSINARQGHPRTPGRRARLPGQCREPTAVLYRGTARGELGWILPAQRPGPGPRAFSGQAGLHAHRARQGRMRRGGNEAENRGGGELKKLPGHIACDKASKSEIVVPMVRGGRLSACSTWTARLSPLR